MDGRQILLPIMYQMGDIARSNIRFLNCWTGIANKERLDDNLFCTTCKYNKDCIKLYHLFEGLEDMHPAFLARLLCKIHEIESEYMRKDEDAHTYALVLIRESGDELYPRCIACNKPAVEVHEIIPRSALGKKHQGELFSMNNRCALCRDCHDIAATDLKRGMLLHRLQKKYGYTYTDDSAPS